MTNYYNILGVPKYATEIEIKDAYRKLCLKYHPDRSTLPNAAEMFRAVDEAYKFLADPTNKRILDEELKKEEEERELAKEQEEFAKAQAEAQAEAEAKAKAEAEAQRQREKEEAEAYARKQEQIRIKTRDINDSKKSNSKKEKEEIPSSMQCEMGFGPVGSFIIVLIFLGVLFYQKVWVPRQEEKAREENTVSDKTFLKYLQQQNKDKTYVIKDN